MNTKTKKTVIRALIVTILAIIIEIASYDFFPGFTLGSTPFNEIIYPISYLAIIVTFTFLFNILAQSLITLIQKDNLHEDTWGWAGAIAGGIIALVLIYLFLAFGMVVS